MSGAPSSVFSLPTPQFLLTELLLPEETLKIKAFPVSTVEKCDSLYYHVCNAAIAIHEKSKKLIKKEIKSPVILIAYTQSLPNKNPKFRVHLVTQSIWEQIKLWALIYDEDPVIWCSDVSIIPPEVLSSEAVCSSEFSITINNFLKEKGSQQENPPRHQNTLRR